MHVGGQRNGILLHGGPAQGECGSLLCVSRRRDQNFLGRLLPGLQLWRDEQGEQGGGAQP